MHTRTLILLSCLAAGCSSNNAGPVDGGVDANVSFPAGSGAGGGAGTGGATVGSGGTYTNTGGSPGAGGTSAGGGPGSGGTPAGSGGVPSSSGGRPGSGGTASSTGGVGSGGVVTGTGGRPGSGGTAAGTGGTTAGSGGTPAGTGGRSGAGGTAAGTGGVVAGAGGVGTGTGGMGVGGNSGSGGATTPPTFAVEFTKADQSKFYSRATNGGSAAFGVANSGAADNNVAELVFKGDPNLGPSEKLTPDYATEIGTNDGTFRYGTYRARVQLARCASNEELVNGIFTYFNDGKDHDGDGMIDNSEIDIEILCSDPSIISLTIWTESGGSGSRNVSRIIRTKTGDYEDTLNDSSSLGKGNNPDFKQSFPDANAFYEMGFEWHANSIRYFMVFGNNEVTLWTYTNPDYIPTLPAAFLFNVWHSDNWWTGGSADYPAADATMRVDWFRYWKE